MSGSASSMTARKSLSPHTSGAVVQKEKPRAGGQLAAVGVRLAERMLVGVH